MPIALILFGLISVLCLAAGQSVVRAVDNSTGIGLAPLLPFVTASVAAFVVGASNLNPAGRGAIGRPIWHIVAALIVLHVMIYAGIILLGARGIPYDLRSASTYAQAWVIGTLVLQAIFITVFFKLGRTYESVKEARRKPRDTDPSDQG